MQIKYEYPNIFPWQRLRNVRKGSAVQFRYPFHQSLSDSDVFIVVDDTAYSQHDGRGKLPVVNLKHGRLSLVSPDREVKIIDAEVRING